LAIIGETAVDEVGGADGDTGGAEPALDRAGLHEALGEQLALVLGQALECRDLPARHSGGIQETRQDRFVIEQNGAAAAYALG
jgi:hypothetical protein